MEYQKTFEKALKINLDDTKYGTLAEIGAGQEVARNFFMAGGAAGTIAKTMSAYDMRVSDAIYGEEEKNRYVSRSRVQKMIDREYKLVVDRLENVRKKGTLFFAFANTVAAKGFKSNSECHGWLGLKFQQQSSSEPCEIILHVRMKDATNRAQQVALGIVGVNLIFGAFYLYNNPKVLIESLVEEVGNDRIEIDMISFHGGAFKNIDNRLMALHLVMKDLTRSAFFTKQGQPINPDDLLYKKNVMFLRGRFRPITNVVKDIIQCGKEVFLKEEGVTEENMVFLAEITMASLRKLGEVNEEDFLGRVDTLNHLGYNVIISNYTRFFRLKKLIERFKTSKIRVLLGVKNVNAIFTYDRYDDVEGGILEAFGMLFSGDTKMYVYPKLHKNKLQTLNNLDLEENVLHLMRHFIYNNKIMQLENYNSQVLKDDTLTITQDIKAGTDTWKSKVPEEIHSLIIDNNLFGYRTV